MSGLQFSIEATDGDARSGRVILSRGEIRTPAFMPVGTAATVKAMLPESVRATGADIILGNTYHLMLRPGAERIQRLGGLHRFMNWPRPILTDSGGFQVMSLSRLRKISDEGVVFQSHIDGSEHRLSPERSMEIQGLLGSDIQMVLDECVALPATSEALNSAVTRSTLWAKRSKAAFEAQQGQGRALFGIVQGGTDPALRLRSAGELLRIGFDGYAIGGLAVGEGHEAMVETIAVIAPQLPPNRPRYLMGVGKPRDLVEAVRRGIDMFDCVMPTRSGRNGQAFIRGGTLNLKNARHADDQNALDPACHCPACAHYSRAYLHHLIRSREILGSMLLSWHNLQHYQDLMADMRGAIAAGLMAAFVRRFYAVADGGQDEDESV